MSKFVNSCFAEYIKVRRSRVFWLTVAALCLAPLFGALFVIVLRNPSLTAGNELLKTKAELTGFGADWPSFFNLVAQAVGVGGVIVFGFVASWVFGREFSDRTVKDILSLPVDRSIIVFSKLAACFIWCLIITAAVIMVGLATGGVLKLPGWEFSGLMAALQKTVVTAMLAILLCPPVAFVASIGRGYLASLGFVIMTVVISQIIGALGYGAYVPWAVPALYSGMGSEAGGSVGIISCAIVIFTGIAGTAAVLYWWKFADQPE